MKPGLQIQIGQHLTMTPQLQQAIRLLQLSTLDLRQEIQEAIEANPLLELEEGEPLDLPDSDDVDLAEVAGDDAALADQDSGVDTDWDDPYTEAPSAGAASDDDMDAWEERTAATTSLDQHLLWQLNLTPMTDADRIIAFAIIESLNDRGYLTCSLEDIAIAARQEMADALPDELWPEEDEVLAVLHRLQHFDPPGVAARDLAESLAIQLRQLPEDTPWRAQALTLTAHLPLLESRDYAQLRRALAVDEQDLVAVIQLLRSLNPHPGDSIVQRQQEYIVPDVIVRRSGRRWRVELNGEALPRVRLNSQYAALAGSKGLRDDDSSYLRNQLQEARWFLKSLQSRNDTLLRVATRIVEVQQGFFEYGEEAMKPLVLAEIASAVEMHESTISRVTSQKYMFTPRGMFELKFFFSSHVGTDGGGECSSTAIRAIIKKLIAAESPKKPLSDSRLASLLNEQGIQVARRTVAKYREAMRIPASSERKRLI
ncbi:RNA polymerase factor sigma-54 [Alcanivorax sp. JB21]|uniref:RNA polymerase factor sigma-54 n=1 Tax=Alcanivorax limicola TaxID=2874102 RepID=UPI001CBD6773|nr:RNA polymerase factor sigma-54 [Alcanivorax limicola]MBZ2189617.1 RNA polymerase factor sigma-54 [Alcanivorax limicola]